MKYVFSVLIFLLISITVTAQETQCSEQLDNAERDYQMGSWDEAINLVNKCLKQENVSEAEKGRAYRILGLVYIAIQLEKEANEAVRNLLIMVPNYKIDPDKDPPQLKTIIDDVSKKLTPKIISINPNSAEKDDKGFTLTVTGSNFVNGSVVSFNGKDKLTYYISTNELKADITSDDLKMDGNVDVCVHSPILKGECSDAQKFNIQKGSSGFPWTWIAIGGGAVAAAVVAVLTLGGSKDKDPVTSSTGLADPPGRP
jgi:tetratricopeptide (TPR) repeat protein